MKPLSKIIFLLVIICNLASCVNVDISRWVINPSIAGLMRNHGHIDHETAIPLIPRPPGTFIEQTRLVSEDKIADISVTHLMVPEQKIGFVFCGGNGFTQSNSAKPILNAFNPTPNILLFDYPGYGLSGGEATFNEFNVATQLLVQHIEQWHKQNHFEKILFWGKSFGGTICARLAGQYTENSALVLETTYNDLYSLVNSRAGVFKHWFQINIDPEAADFHINQSLAHYAHPIAIIKSTNDPITPPQESDKLAKLLRGQGNNVVLLSMGKARHAELLFHPCEAGPVLKQLKPVIGDLTLNTAGCSANK
jgi:pimeloyl-ACP methyl ester carboxylesterase